MTDVIAEVAETEAEVVETGTTIGAVIGTEMTDTTTVVIEETVEVVEEEEEIGTAIAETVTATMIDGTYPQFLPRERND